MTKNNKKSVTSVLGRFPCQMTTPWGLTLEALGVVFLKGTRNVHLGELFGVVILKGTQNDHLWGLTLDTLGVVILEGFQNEHLWGATWEAA